MRLALAALALAFFAQGQDLTIPPGAPAAPQALYTTQGRGVQIYSCDQQNGTLQWIFQAPEAKLFDTAIKEQLGTHGAGPSWTWKDGSSVTGKVVQKFPSPDPGSIPWLLLAAQPVPGHAGALSQVVWVRRSETQGGNPPSEGCDQAHRGATARVPYIAAYTFYSSAVSSASPSATQH